MRPSSRHTRCCTSALLVLFLCVPLRAQTPAPAPEAATREEALRLTRESKARAATPHKPNNAQKWVARLENDRLIEDWLSVGEGGRYYLKFGGITTGAGLSLGPGIRIRRLAGGNIDIDAFFVGSYRRYWLAQGSIIAPRLADTRVQLGALVRRKYFPQEDFFGIGPLSNRPDRVSYTYTENAVGGFAGFDLTDGLHGEARLEYLSPEVTAGKDTRYPSIEALFGDLTAPGLAAQPPFIMARASLDFDYATPAGNPRRGGRYLASGSRFTDRDTGFYSFNRYDFDLRQYVPFLKDRRVLVFRAMASFSDAGDGEVPFYFQQTLGGGSTLRGFRDYRFRDRNLLLFQGEYRWEILPALDAALFYDTGMVAPTASELDLDDLERDYGFGFRFGTNRGVFFRVDAGFGSPDGKHLFIKFGNVF
jgi:outer membrane protein assembly factor BamA